MLLRGRLRGQDGSIVLEAAIVLPFFAAFLLVISFFLSVAQTTIALRDAVEELVKTAAAHAYPVDLLVHAYKEHPTVRQVETAIDRYLPSEIVLVLESALHGGAERASETLLKPALLSYVDQTQSGRKMLKEQRLSIRSVTLPTFADENGSYFGLTVEYTVPIPIPFVGGEIKIVESAYERCWVGDK